MSTKKKKEFEPKLLDGEYYDQPVLTLQFKEGERLNRFNSIGHSVAKWKIIIDNIELIKSHIEELSNE